MKEKVDKDINFELPKTCVQRICKKSIPENVSISNDSKLAFSKAAVVLYIFILLN
jgi:histone H3/H4